MSANQLSIIFLVVSLFLAIGVYIFLKPQKYQIKSAIIAGIILSSLNFILEAMANKLNWYYTSGAWEILGVPVSLSIMWLSLGFCFCLMYSYLDNLKNPKIVRIIFILVSAISGLIYDIKIGSSLGLVKFEQTVKIYHIFTIWLTFILITILIYNSWLNFFTTKNNCSNIK